MCGTGLDPFKWSHCDTCSWNRPLPTFMTSEVYDPDISDESDMETELSEELSWDYQHENDRVANPGFYLWLWYTILSSVIAFVFEIILGL